MLNDDPSKLVQLLSRQNRRAWTDLTPHRYSLYASSVSTVYLFFIFLSYMKKDKK
jgi:hypothetical protein